MKSDQTAWKSLYDWCRNETHAHQISRRTFLKTSVLTALIASNGDVAGAADKPAADALPPPNKIAPGDALKRLMEGNARYVTNSMNERDFSAGRAARAQAQYPIAAILSCADSRVAPELAFDQEPGNLFVVRVAGNIVTADLLASIEYSVYFLGVPLVMVLGHTGCGAVGAAIKVLQTKAVLPGHLPELVTAIKPAVIVTEKTQPANLLDSACIENVRQQVNRLKHSPPVMEKSYAAKQIDVVGAIYDLTTGKITLV